MLTQEQQKICSLMGMNPHIFIEALNREQTEALNTVNPDSQILYDRAMTDIAKAMKITPQQLKQLQKDIEASELTPEEAEVCHKMGIRPVEYLYEKMKTAGVKGRFMDEIEQLAKLSQ